MALLSFTIVSCFCVVRINPTLFDGECSKVIECGRGQVLMFGSWDSVPGGYKVKLTTELTGKGFAVQKDSLKMVLTDFAVGADQPAAVSLKHDDLSSGFSIERFRIRIHRLMTQSIFVGTETDARRIDSCSASLLPCGYIMYNGERVLNDTIKLTFEKNLKKL